MARPARAITFELLQPGLNAELRFTHLASDHLQTINAGLKDATDLLHSMRAYVESLDHP